MSDQPNDTSARIEYDRLDNMNCPSCGALVDLADIEPFSMIECPACGASMEVPAKFAHFRLLKRLGSGGMGTTFLAEDEGLDRKVAIKVMQNFMAEDPKAFDTFKNEAQSAARLNHPHVAQVYSFGREKGIPYLEMELVPGGDLSKFIADGTVLDPAFVIRVGMEIAEGLKAAEEGGLFHGDVKPENILFDENMNAKLVDFGLASRSSQGKSDELWGTPYYIAPDKVQKKMNSARSDIFSLGATLYHAIAGKPPFDGADPVEVIKARFKGPAKPLDQVRPGVEPEVARIVTRMMYSDLFQRYPNYNSLIGDMKKYLSGVPKLRKQGPKPSASFTRKNSTGLVEGEAAAGSPQPSGSKKKFVITKGSMEAAEARMQMEAAEAAAAGGSPSQKSGGKIVLKKHGGSVLGPLPKGEGASGEPAGEPVIGPDGQPVLGPDGKPLLKKPSGGKALKALLIGLLVVLVLVVGGVVTGVVMYNNRKKAEMRHLQELRDKAAQIERDYAGLTSKIAGPLNRIRERDAEAAKIVAAVNDLCEKATGERFETPDLEPNLPPEVDLSAEIVSAVGDAMVGAMTNALAQAMGGLTNALAGALAINPDGSAAPAAAAPAPEAPKPKPRKRSAFKVLAEMYAEDNGFQAAQAEDLLRQEAKANGMTAEEYAKKMLADNGVEIGDDGEIVEAEPDADGGGDGAGGASYGVVGGGDAAEEAPAAHPFFGLVDNALWGPAREIRECLRRCERLAEKEGVVFERIPDLATEPMILQAIEVREGATTARKALVKQARDLAGQSENALKVLRSKKKDLEREGKRFQAERERKLKAEREEREAREAEERANQQEAARKAVAEEEVSRVQAVADKFKPRVVAFEYDGFLDALQKMEDELSQPESREELRWTMERVRRVKELRTWILGDLRKNGVLRQGYQNKYDIQGVTSNGRELTLPPPKPNVPVSKLQTKDWLLLIRMLIENRSPERRSLNTMERGELYLNAAPFCYLHGGDNFNAMNLCKKYAKEAITLRTAYAHDARMLIPILAEELGPEDAAGGDGDESSF